MPGSPGRVVRPLLITILGLSLAVPGTAQRSETLLGRGFESGGFGGPMVQLMPMADDMAIFAGGRGGWIINHTFSIGGGGWGLVNDVATSVTDTASDARLNIGYGGLILEFIGRPFELVHYTLSLLSGWGAAEYDTGTEPAESFYVLEPAAQVELNVTDFFRVGAGVSYRYTWGIDLEGFTDDDMRRTAGVITLKFGSF